MYEYNDYIPMKATDFINKLCQSKEHETYEITTEDERFNVFVFTFYTFDSFTYFITQSFNFYHTDVYSFLKFWYIKGFCSEYIIHDHFVKNKDIFINIECVSHCVFSNNNDHEYNVDRWTTKSFFLVNPLQHKIIVYYELYTYEDGYEYIFVRIHIPTICKQCIPNTNKHLYHNELLSKVKTKLKHIKCIQYNAITTMHTFKLYEPMLINEIWKYLI